MHLDLEEVSVAEPVTSALATLSPQADAKGVSLESSVAPDLPTIQGHAPSLRRVLVNLVGNALKFTDRGGRVSVDVSTVDGEGAGASRGAVRVTVADSGVGIPPEQLDSIFEKFHQVDPHSQTTTPGTGLGLSICQNWSWPTMGASGPSDPGQGSRFSFVIPLSLRTSFCGLAGAQRARKDS
jgi:signal transduction histidine kinase